MSTFLIGAAFAVLLALAIATVVTGVVTALKIGPPPPPITRNGHWEPHTLPDGTTEHTWTAHQTDHQPHIPQ
ncbi:hypothetical protein ADK60_31670 [Streptomyces sp. XY431]|uniref:hypothetical protein n=1 Tax=Streptomyces sp. XY431 TaxID=1415562 RepID=UPI0006AE5E7E|nr:hypothetical protein [Streptomyces sp. XY431]KOV12291.1 hypothetical protein ADK60_31670 [Streptomyces sp. XY431]